MASHCLQKSVELQLRQLPGNNICCDCDGKGPQWASVSFGVFMCLDCSGRHRALGVHISFVRSVTMDSWSEKQIQLMRLGGNDKFNNFLKEYDVPKTLTIPQKYNTAAATFYREKLNAEASGLPAPTNVPSKFQSGASISDSRSSDPLAGESEADYVARQRRLQEEAKDRMRQKFGQSNGLSSSGRMQGIGSDSSYRPGETTNSAVEFPAIDVAQLADASQKALSFFQSSFSAIGEHVSKTTQQLMDESNKSNNQPVEEASPWASLTSGAINLWKQAAEATTDIIVQISNNEPTEEDFRFPRPQEVNCTAERPANEQQSKYRSQETIPAEKSASSFVPNDMPPKLRNPTNFDTQAPTISPNSTTISPQPRHTAPQQVNTPSQKAKVATPVGDDFFATFGV